MGILRKFGLVSMLLFVGADFMSVSAQVKVVDADTEQPVSYASVIESETGKVMGMTNSEGEIAVAFPAQSSFCFQHINYKPITISGGDMANHVVQMQPCTYQVPEMVVNKEQHEYIRLKCYVRDYSTINGRVAQVEESMCNYYFSQKKQGGMPKIQYLGIQRFRNDSAFAGQKAMISAFAENGGLPFYNFLSYKKYEELKGGRKLRDYDKGVKRNTLFLREDTAHKQCEIVLDSGYVEKPFHFPLFGVSVTNLYSSQKYSTAYGTPSLSGLQDAIYAYRVIHNKTQNYVDIYTEIYVVGVDYADAADYKAIDKQVKEQIKSHTLPPIERPEGCPPLNAQVEQYLKGGCLNP